MREVQAGSGNHCMKQPSGRCARCKLAAEIAPRSSREGDARGASWQQKSLHEAAAREMREAQAGSRNRCMKQPRGRCAGFNSASKPRRAMKRDGIEVKQLQLKLSGRCARCNLASEPRLPARNHDSGRNGSALLHGSEPAGLSRMLGSARPPSRGFAFGFGQDDAAASAAAGGGGIPGLRSHRCRPGPADGHSRRVFCQSMRLRPFPRQCGSRCGCGRTRQRQIRGDFRAYVARRDPAFFFCAAAAERINFAVDSRRWDPGNP